MSVSTTVVSTRSLLPSSKPSSTAAPTKTSLMYLSVSGISRLMPRLNASCLGTLSQWKSVNWRSVTPSTLAQLAIIPVLDAHQNQRAHHLTRGEAVAALARIFQPAVQIALHSLQHLTVLLKQIANRLQRRVELHALKRQLEVGKGHLPRRRPRHDLTHFSSCSLASAYSCARASTL